MDTLSVVLLIFLIVFCIDVLTAIVVRELYNFKNRLKKNNVKPFGKGKTILVTRVFKFNKGKRVYDHDENEKDVDNDTSIYQCEKCGCDFEVNQECKKFSETINDVKYDWIVFEDGSGSVTSDTHRIAIFDLATREVDTGTGWTFTDICTFKDVRRYIYNVLGVDVSGATDPGQNKGDVDVSTGSI